VSMATQAAFFKVNWFRVDIWREWGQHLGGRGKNHYADELELNEKQAAIVEKAGWLMWDVGDWLVAAELGGMKMSQLRREAAGIFPHREWKTLRHWKMTSKAIESSRRRDGRQGREGLDHWEKLPILSYSMHKEVEKFPPQYQDELLAIAVEWSADKRGPRCSVGKFRAYIKDRQKDRLRSLNTNAELSKPDPKTNTHVVKVKMKMTEDAYRKFVKYSEARGMRNLDQLFDSIVRDYVRRNEKEILAKVAEYDESNKYNSRMPKWPEPQEEPAQ
jgi:hypothetical protein